MLLLTAQPLAARQTGSFGTVSADKPDRKDIEVAPLQEPAKPIPRGVLMALGCVGVVAVIVAIFAMRGKAPSAGSTAPVAAQTPQSPAAPQASDAGSPAAGVTAGSSADSAGAAPSAAPAGRTGGTAASRKPARAAAVHHDHDREHPGRASAASRSARASTAAEGGGEMVSERVSLAGLDLSTEKGACTALKKIKRAAESLCTSDDPLEVYMGRERRECVEDSVARAVKATHSARMEALHAKSSDGC
jgi:UrcA family protein